MKSVLLIAIVVAFCTPNLVFAQKAEVGILAGPTYYYGDIVNTFEPSSIRGGLNFFYRYHLDPQLTVRANFSALLISGDDAASNTEWQQVRNMSFTTNIIELSAVGEYNLRPDRNKGRRVKDGFIPYVFAGVGAIYFESYRRNPISGNLVSLRQLQLDGTQYAPIAIVVPLGIGMRYYLSRNWTVGAELGLRFTSTSQLDNVTGKSVYPAAESLPSDLAREMYDPSERERARPNKPRGKIDYITDVYVMSGVSLSYRIWPKGVKRHKGTAIRCPRFY